MPNPFIGPLREALREFDVEFSDFELHSDEAHIGNTFLNVEIRKLDSAIRVGLDAVRFSARNTEWSQASKLVLAFEQASGAVNEITGATCHAQEAVLAMHVVSETSDFQALSGALVNREKLGNANFYGVAIHRRDGMLIIDKSMKYKQGVYVRLERRFAQSEGFPEVAAKMLDEEVAGLALLGLGLEEATV